MTSQQIMYVHLYTCISNFSVQNGIRKNLQNSRCMTYVTTRRHQVIKHSLSQLNQRWNQNMRCDLIHSTGYVIHYAATCLATHNIYNALVSIIRSEYSTMQMIIQ